MSAWPAALCVRFVPWVYSVCLQFLGDVTVKQFIYQTVGRTEIVLSHKEEVFKDSDWAQAGWHCHPSLGLAGSTERSQLLLFHLCSLLTHGTFSQCLLAQVFESFAWLELSGDLELLNGSLGPCFGFVVMSSATVDWEHPCPSQSRSAAQLQLFCARRSWSGTLKQPDNCCSSSVVCRSDHEGWSWKFRSR